MYEVKDLDKSEISKLLKIVNDRIKEGIKGI